MNQQVEKINALTARVSSEDISDDLVLSESVDDNLMDAMAEGQRLMSTCMTRLIEG